MIDWEAAAEAVKNLPREGDLFPEPRPEDYFNHAVMVMITVKSRNQDEAQEMVAAILETLEAYSAAAWENARVVVSPRKGWNHDGVGRTP